MLTEISRKCILFSTLRSPVSFLLSLVTHPLSLMSAGHVWAGTAFGSMVLFLTHFVNYTPETLHTGTALTSAPS